ncbi:MAG TPA: hypothetical protein VNT20_18280 [Flavisolibacter sp.]|jgi:hypothetical protein|nr:hypothetical protein [Flavisolibacter sp.]
MKGITWELLPSTVETLKSKMVKHKEVLDTIIQKADVEDEETLQKAVYLNNDVQEISKNLHKQFCQLRANYNSGEINLARYRSYLKPIHDFLVERDEKIKNEHLHLEEDIVPELAKHF